MKFHYGLLSFVLTCIITPFSLPNVKIVPSKLTALVNINTKFALELYQELRELDGNLFFSPYSISTALAMTSAGAREGTATQMEQTLQFNIQLPG